MQGMLDTYVLPALRCPDLTVSMRSEDSQLPASASQCLWTFPTRLVWSYRAGWKCQRINSPHSSPQPKLMFDGGRCLSSISYDKLLWTWWLINNTFISYFLESGSLRSVCQHGWVLVRALFWVAECCLFLQPHMAEKDSGRALWGPLIRALIPLLRTPPL